MNPKASIIMPAYNATRWIGQAVESVLRQKEPDWELLIIDDGSHDGSRELATALAAKDPRIRVLRNARGKGPGGARNTGLEEARGKAVIFLDSDDILFPDAVGALHHALTRGGSPVLRAGGVTFCQKRWMAVLTYSGYKEDSTAGRGKDHTTLFSRTGERRSSLPSVQKREDSFPPAAFCCHIYDRVFLERHNITFPAYNLGEDRVFICHAYLHAGSIPVVNIPISIYRINHKPIPHSPKRAGEFVAYNRDIRALFEEHGREDLTAPYISEVFFPEWLSHLHGFPPGNEEAALRFLDECRLLLAGLEKDLAGALRRTMGSTAGECLSLAARGDSAGMLALLSRREVLRSPSPYIGIPAGAGGPGYVLARRAANLLRGSLPVRTIARMAGLSLGHTLRMARATRAGGVL